MKYSVTLKFIYSDTVHVEAESEKEAVSLALNDCEENYESFYDSTVRLEETL